MAITVSFTVSNSGGVAPRKYSLLTENSSFINSIITVGKNNTITLQDMERLEATKRLAGDLGILEECDISGINNLKNKISSNDASYNEWGIFSAFSNANASHLTSDYIHVNVPTGTCLYNVKQMFKLPDGALDDYVKTEYGSTPENKDKLTVTDGEVWFKPSAFALGNAMTVDEVRAMFK